MLHMKSMDLDGIHDGREHIGEDGGQLLVVAVPQQRKEFVQLGVQGVQGPLLARLWAQPFKPSCTDLY